ncbi:rhythmically expressed gene 2 protein-like isoform X2 [Nilaparvata lugens]|uniref:rhythmically expressed gene 2 protein-like isoform X2 n=1 Tax=Nilaparvata lugens TaxID=108931 RepID=UPI00193D94A9|nr:rhythmically expressed gene 2 protein-like isoform X2 [Nilaparvata lugens]
MRFKLVTLDIFGTVLKLQSDVGHQYSKAGAKFGVHVNQDLLLRNFKEVWLDMNQKYPIYGVQSFGWRKWWEKLIYKTFSKSSSVEVNRESVENISQHLFEMYKKAETWKLCDGALDFMNTMHDKHIPLVVISNFDSRLEDLLLTMNVRHYFKLVIASYNVGVQKPDLSIFQLVEDKLKQFPDLADIRKHEIIHIGDSPELDYISATRAGWNSFLIQSDSDAVIKKYPLIAKIIFLRI